MLRMCSAIARFVDKLHMNCFNLIHFTGRPFLPRTSGIYCSLECCHTPVQQHRRPLIDPVFDVREDIGLFQTFSKQNSSLLSRADSNVIVRPSFAQPTSPTEEDLSLNLANTRLSASAENVYESVPSTARTMVQSCHVNERSSRRDANRNSAHRRHYSAGGIL